MLTRVAATISISCRSVHCSSLVTVTQPEYSQNHNISQELHQKAYRRFSESRSKIVWLLLVEPITSRDMNVKSRDV